MVPVIIATSKAAPASTGKPFTEERSLPRTTRAMLVTAKTYPVLSVELIMALDPLRSKGFR